MMDERDWTDFKRKLKAKTEIDLDLYKEPQMKRRIGNLVTRAGMDSYSGYFDRVVKDKNEFASFIEYLTINVSEFFRTPEKFGKLETDVIPDLLKRTSKLNIWSAGCSIGAEPYSLAIIMKEMTPNLRHRILASDLDVEILAKAKRGIYTENELKAMTPQRRAKYFDVVEGDKFAVKQEIKNCIEFKRHNLLKDPFESGFDLILCRNVVIYFTEEAKDQISRKYYHSLAKGGMLFIGSTEQIMNYREIGFDRKSSFYYVKPL